MTSDSHAIIVSRNDYPVIIIIVGAVVLAASIFASSNDFALFIAPLSIVIIGVGIVLTVKRNDAASRKGKGLARHQRFILFNATMLLLALFSYVLAIIITSQ